MLLGVLLGALAGCRAPLSHAGHGHPVEPVSEEEPRAGGEAEAALPAAPQTEQTEAAPANREKAPPRVESPAEPDRPREGWNFGGDATVGVRVVEVSGSEDQFDADHQLDPGFRFLAFSARGERFEDHERAESFAVTASGIDDGYTNVRGEYRRADLWSVKAKFERSNFPYVDSTELHPWNPVRLNYESEFRYTPEGRQGPTFGVRADRTERDGDGIFTRYLEGDLLAPMRVDDERVSDRAAIFSDFEAIGFNWSVEGNVLRERRDDDRRLSVPSPQDPLLLETEDFRANGELRSPGVLLRGRSELAADVLLDLALHYRTSSVDADYSSAKTGVVTPGVTYAQDESGEADATRQQWGGEAGLAFTLDEALELFLGAEHETIDERGDGSILEIRQEPIGSTPVAVTSVYRTSAQVQREALFAELDWDAAETLRVRPGLRFEYDRYDLADGAGDLKQDISGWMPTLHAEYEPEKDWRFDMDLLRESRTDAFQPIDPGRVWRANLRARRGFTEELSATLQVAGSTLENRVADAEGRAFSTNLAGAYEGKDGWHGTAAYTYATARSHADTLIWSGVVQQPFETRYVARSHAVSFELGKKALIERVDTFARWSYVGADGSSAFRSQRLGGGIEVQVADDATVGLSADWYEYDQHEPSDFGDYDAFVALLYLRVRFP